MVWLLRSSACDSFSKRKPRAPFSRMARPATSARSMRAMHSSVVAKNSFSQAKAAACSRMRVPMPISLRTRARATMSATRPYSSSSVYPLCAMSDSTSVVGRPSATVWR